MQDLVRQSQDWRIATTHLDLRHVPTGVLFRLKPRILIDTSNGHAVRNVLIYPVNLGCVSRVPAMATIDVLRDEARVMGALLYGIAIDGS